jgi:hypothetical protein
VTWADIEKIALVIGNNIGLSTEPPLQYACDDARSIYDILTSLGGINPNRSYLLLNCSPRKASDTFKEIAGRVKELKSQQRQVQLIVYYSGHGGDDAFHLQGEKLMMSDLHSLFDEVDADLRILIADACHSGALIQAKGGTLTPTYDISLQNDLGVKGTVFITSSSPVEYSHESKELRGSLFSYYLASGLRGAADFDHDDRISLWEAYSFAKVNTNRQGSHYKDFSQTPEFDFDISGNETVMLTNIGNARSLLSFKYCQNGLYEIFEENSMRQVAGVYVTEGDSAKIVLPKNNYVVRRLASNKVFLGKVDLSWGGVRQVDSRQLKPFPLDALAKKGVDLRFEPHALALQSTVLRSLPDGGGVWVIPELAYQYSNYASALTLYCGFTRDRLSGQYFDLNRRIVSVAGSGHYFLLNRTRVKYYTGAQVRLLVMDQQPIRAREGELGALGYQPMPLYRAMVWGMGLSQGLIFNLPLPLSLEVAVTPTMFFSSNPAGYLGYHFRLPLTTALRWRF